VRMSTKLSCCLPGEKIALVPDGDVIRIVGGGAAPAGRKRDRDTTGESVIATHVVVPVLDAGRITASAPHMRRYVPQKGDVVVGVVVRSLGLCYVVSIGSAHLAMLDALAFDGASKVNKPRLRVGDAVFAHVLSSHLSTELSCCALPGTEAKDWTTREGTFGSLDGGLLITTTCDFARSVFDERSSLLDNIGREVSFEACVGVNGKLWLRTSNVSTTITVARCILECAKDGSRPDEVIRTFFPSVLQ